MAIALDRNNSRAIRQLGMVLEFTGQPELAIPYVEKSLRLNPREGASSAGIAYAVLGTNYFFIGEVDRVFDRWELVARSLEAVLAGERAAVARAITGAQEGDIDEARCAIAVAQAQTDSKLRCGMA